MDVETSGWLAFHDSLPPKLCAGSLGCHSEEMTATNNDAGSVDMMCGESCES